MSIICQSIINRLEADRVSFPLGEALYNLGCGGIICTDSTFRTDGSSVRKEILSFINRSNVSCPLTPSTDGKGFTSPYGRDFLEMRSVSNSYTFLSAKIDHSFVYTIGGNPILSTERFQGRIMFEYHISQKRWFCSLCRVSDNEIAQRYYCVDYTTPRVEDNGLYSF